MKQRRRLLVLLIEATVCLVLALTAWMAVSTQFSLLSLPFALPGQALRALSLLGGGWNVLAITLYALLALLPALWFVRVCTSRRTAGADWLLLLMSATLFGTLYAAVNPTWPNGTLIGGSGMGMTVFAVVFYTETAVWLVLRLLRAARNADAAGLRKLSARVLMLLSAVFVYSAFAEAPAALFQSLRTLSAQNSSAASASGFVGMDVPVLFWTQAVFVLRTLVSMVADGLSVWVIFAALDLLSARDAENPELAEAAAEQLSHRSALALRITLLAALGIDLVQLVLLRQLRSNAFHLTLPLGAMALCLGTLLLTRLVQENRRLRRDNDLFI